MAIRKKLLDIKGIVTVLNTPFNDEGSLDLVSLGRNVKAALDANVAGFLVPALAAEVYKLNHQEKITMVSEVMNIAGSAVPVIGSATTSSIDQSVSMARDLVDLGCSGILVFIPFKSVEQYREDVNEISKVDMPFLMLQDWDPNGGGIPTWLIKELFDELDVFKALKIEVIPAGIKYSEVLEMTGGALHVSGGWAVMQMIEALERGVHAFMPTGMHRIYTQIYRLFKQDKKDEATKLFNSILPVLAFSNQHLDISIHFFKRLMFEKGIFDTPNVRDPILKFDEIHENVARKLIDRVIQIEKSL
ncbi:MAG: dihydrodipicolinate synthase family protein [Promethearchaeota archaeon]